MHSLFSRIPPPIFDGDNQNAIEIQIWSPLLDLLLLSVIHCKNKTRWPSVCCHGSKTARVQLYSITQLLTQYKKKQQEKYRNKPV